MTTESNDTYRNDNYGVEYTPATTTWQRFLAYAKIAQTFVVERELSNALIVFFLMFTVVVLPLVVVGLLTQQLSTLVGALILGIIATACFCIFGCIAYFADGSSVGLSLLLSAVLLSPLNAMWVTKVPTLEIEKERIEDKREAEYEAKQAEIRAEKKQQLKECFAVGND